MRNRHGLSVAAVVLAGGLAWLTGTRAVAPAGVADANAGSGTATLSGVVEAPKPFKAAKVYIMNVDKNVLFMVYTSGGRYRAANLFPRNYEGTVRAGGVAGNPQKIELAAGAGRAPDLTLRRGPAPGARQGGLGFTTHRPGALQ